MKRPAVKCVMKKPVAKTIMKKPTMKASKMKLGTSKTDANMLVRVSPFTTCSVCKGILTTRSDERPSECTIVGSESFDIAKTYRKECAHWKSRSTHRANFAYQEGAKINTLTFEQMKELGFYLVTKKFGFTFKYLELSFLRLLRGNLASGQEASVRDILAKNETKMITPRRFQSHLMRALEGYAVAQRNPNKVIPFNVDHPASFFKFARVSMVILESTDAFIKNMSPHEQLLCEVVQRKSITRRMNAHAHVPTKRKKGNTWRTGLLAGSSCWIQTPKG